MVPEPAKFEAVPLPTVISPTTNPVTDSLKVIVTGIGDVLVVAGAVDVIVTADDGSNLAPHLRAALFSRRAVPVVAISADGNSIDVYERWATQGYGVAGTVHSERALHVTLRKS